MLRADADVVEDVAGRLTEEQALALVGKLRSRFGWAGFEMTDAEVAALATRHTQTMQIDNPHIAIAAGNDATDAVLASATWQGSGQEFAETLAARVQDIIEATVEQSVVVYSAMD